MQCEANRPLPQKHFTCHEWPPTSIMELDLLKVAYRVSRAAKGDVMPPYKEALFVRLPHCHRELCYGVVEGQEERLERRLELILPRQEDNCFCM